MDTRTARTYQLRITVPESVRVPVGKLGTFEFPAGRYTYTGSAKSNLEARVQRHCTGAARLRWHIDYLLAAPGVTVADVRRSARDECTLNQRTRGEVLVPRFGASDCRRGCGSHLKYLGRL